ncbi:MAG: DNA alkylation repair protein [Bacteroidaceae bacterium]|nr:DNA alkylation repair protein [Bacteroidaceae bacterium]MBR1755099.1 DNA alkylation repair protein [Bacteroidaceae bacterium]
MSNSPRPVVGGSSADLLPQLRADLRAAMNGVAAKAIRESGMGYRLAYGIELPRLREIAAGYTPDRRLALELWQEDVREYRLLAIMLFPAEEFDTDMADLWVSSLRPEQAELAQLLSMDLLSRQPYAAELSFQWMAAERPVQQLCGFLVLGRLLMNGAELAPDAAEEFLDQAAATLPTASLPLRKAVQNALLRYGESSPEAARRADRILAS